MTLYGYARVSVREPEDKNLDLQVEMGDSGRRNAARATNRQHLRPLDREDRGK